MIQAGEKAPDFCLPDGEEREVCLDSFRGKWVVLYFYPKDNTQGCTLEAVDFTTAKEDFASQGAVIIGVSRDSAKSHTNFAQKHDLDIILLSDPERRVHEQYGVWQLKKMYGKESFGTVRSTFLIDPDGVVRFVWEKVKVADHTSRVLEKLIELKRQ
ncbi:MAG: peroxiredoxin [Deltaproteobacteria bacterium]|nr:peroxiredoxin [Candidatus Zymogenaceae bacterium]